MTAKRHPFLTDEKEQDDGQEFIFLVLYGHGHIAGAYYDIEKARNRSQHVSGVIIKLSILEDMREPGMNTEY